MLALVFTLTAFAPQAPMSATAVCGRAAAPCMSFSSRRTAIGQAASVAALAAVMPRAAFAESSEEAIARIAAKNKAAQEVEREKAKAKIAKNLGKVERENAGSNVLVGLIGAAGFVFSLPFF